MGETTDLDNRNYEIMCMMRKMQIHDVIELEGGIIVHRVPGGWIYRFYEQFPPNRNAVVFVPEPR